MSTASMSDLDLLSQRLKLINAIKGMEDNEFYISLTDLDIEEVQS